MPKVLVPLAQSCEELEAVTLIDLFRRAGFDVTTACLEAQPTTVVASRGTRLLPDTTLDEALRSEYDMVVLPGGLPGADHLNDDERIVSLVREMVAQERIVAAICAAPRVLARAGVLEGRQATSYPGTLDVMEIPGMSYVKRPVVVDGPVVTSMGPGTAMEFALVLIAILGGEALRDEVEGPLLRP